LPGYVSIRRSSHISSATQSSTTNISSNVGRHQNQRSKSKLSSEKECYLRAWDPSLGRLGDPGGFALGFDCDGRGEGDAETGWLSTAGESGRAQHVLDVLHLRRRRRSCLPGVGFSASGMRGQHHAKLGNRPPPAAARGDERLVGFRAGLRRSWASVSDSWLG
jgi:hypothetical protein